MNEDLRNLKTRQLNALYKTFNEGTSSKTAIKYVQTGRENYVNKFTNMLDDVKSTKESTTKFLIADYGVGKSFLIDMLVEAAKADNFLVSKVDLSPERLLYHKEKALQTYSLIMSNLTCKGSTNALENMFQKLASEAMRNHDYTEVNLIVNTLRKNIEQLKAYPNGNDLVTIICKYTSAYLRDDEMTMSCCMKWIRGEYENRQLLKRELGIDKLINSENYKQFLVLINRMGRLCGYNGLVVFIDECVNIKDAYHTTRKKNYETILNIYNETTQGEIKECIFMFAGDVEFLTNTQKGLYSYDALRQRLDSEDVDYIDLDSPVWRLKYLTTKQQEELCQIILDVFTLKFEMNLGVEQYHIDNYVQELNEGLKHEQVVTRDIIKKFTSRLNKIKNGDATADELFVFKATDITKPVEVSSGFDDEF